MGRELQCNEHLGKQSGIATAHLDGTSLAIDVIDTRAKIDFAVAQRVALDQLRKRKRRVEASGLLDPVLGAMPPHHSCMRANLIRAVCTRP